ncbi:OB-fold domain-containing protein [Citricoccus nitrophenolicus]
MDQTGRQALTGSRCDDCGTVAFPEAVTCRKCAGRSLSTLGLSPEGTVWAHTVQRFRPKSPPYVEPTEGFSPFAVGYVELAEGIKVEAIIDGAAGEELHGAQVFLVATQPVPRFATAAAAATAPTATTTTAANEGN